MLKPRYGVQTYTENTFCSSGSYHVEILLCLDVTHAYQHPQHSFFFVYASIYYEYVKRNTKQKHIMCTNKCMPTNTYIHSYSKWIASICAKPYKLKWMCIFWMYIYIYIYYTHIYIYIYIYIQIYDDVTSTT